MEFTWILPLVAGYVLGIVWSNLVTIGRTGMFVQKVGDQTLKLIINVAEDFVIFNFPISRFCLNKVICFLSKEIPH